MRANTKRKFNTLLALGFAAMVSAGFAWLLISFFGQSLRDEGWANSNSLFWFAIVTSVVSGAAVLFLQPRLNRYLHADPLAYPSTSIATDAHTPDQNSQDNFLKGIMDDLHDEVFIYEVKTLSVLYVNSRAQERCGWTDGGYIGKKISDSDPSFSQSIFRQHVEPLLQGTKDIVKIEAMQEKGPVEVKTRLHRNENGQEYFVSLLRDTTEYRMIEKARIECMSIVSHELRTPLTSIKGALRLLQAEVLGKQSDEVKPILDIAVRNSDRLLFVVNDILEHEKRRSGKIELNPRRENVGQFLKDAISANQEYASEFDVKLDLVMPSDDFWASIEINRMMQVMSNLISNAVKFSPKHDTVLVELKDEGEYLRIDVHDNGPGIPVEMQTFLFESFTQLESPDGRQREGTGLGLAISKSIVASHGGRISFRSKVGLGSTFFVELKKLGPVAIVDKAVEAQTSAA